jgi:hypothetical protein
MVKFSLRQQEMSSFHFSCLPVNPTTPDPDPPMLTSALSNTKETGLVTLCMALQMVAELPLFFAGGIYCLR